MVAALSQYWLLRNRYADAVHWIDQTLPLPGAVDPAIRVSALCAKALCLKWLGRPADQRAVLAEAEAIARPLGNPRTLSQVLQLQASQELDSGGRLELRRALAEEALHWATAADDEWEVANASFAWALTASDPAELRNRVESAGALAERVGNVDLLAGLLSSAAYEAVGMRSALDARRFAERALPIERSLNDPFTWMLTQGNLGLAAVLTGDTDAARDAFRDELRLARELAVGTIVAEGLLGLAAVAVASGNLPRAAQLVGAAKAHRDAILKDDVIHALDAAYFRDARDRCRSDAWDAAIQQGAALTLEEAIALALDEPTASIASP